MRTTRRGSVLGAALLAQLAMLTGCGMKGDLYLPEPEDEDAEAPRPVPEAPDDEDVDDAGTPRSGAATD